MDNKRLILLAIFLFSLFMLWDAWQKQNRLPAPVTQAQTATQGSVVPTPSAPSGNPAPEAIPEALATGENKVSEAITIKTDLLTAKISLQGGDIVELLLNDYKTVEDKNRVFALFEPKHHYVAQSGLIGEGLANHKTQFSALAGPRELSADDKTVQLHLEATTGGVTVTKIYTFTRGSYLIDVVQEIDNGSQKTLSAHAYYQLQRDTVTPDGESGMAKIFTGPAVYSEQEKYQKISFEDIEKGKAKFIEKASDGWIAMVQHYFVSAWIPQENLSREYFIRKLGADISAGVIVPMPQVAPGEKASRSVSLYAGPQIQSVLNQLAKPAEEGGIGAKGLALVVDYGWLTIVAAPIFWCLEMIHKLVGNWGWAIIILTIIIKLLFFPLSAASYKSMAKMKAVAPRMNALRERYGDDKQRINQELMNLYRTEKINPLGGCLPILIQIPVFLALYWALLGAVEMRDAPWIFWIKDLSSKDPYYVLPIIMAVTMFIQTKLNPTPPDPMQAKVMLMMPLVFGFMFLFFPAGLVLYWVVNNIFSIVQQWQITRMIESGGKAANDAKA